jgi:CopG antitoxin of type II toxin-antitoxin system
MSSRIKITLPDHIAAELDELADAEGEPVARVTARMVRERLVKLSAGDPRVLSIENPARPPWLEPYGGDREWRKRMWGAIVALYGRYPDELKGLKRDWWEDTSQVETLCALVVWRETLDDHGSGDPREELEFQLNVAEFGRRLAQQGGGVTKAWTPGAPPDEWA